MLGWELDTLLDRTLQAMRATESQINAAWRICKILGQSCPSA
jgi:hypothetical protein